MAYLFAMIPPLALMADPLAGIVVSGSAGFITGLLGAALLGSLLYGLRERWAGNRGRFEAHV